MSTVKTAILARVFIKHSTVLPAKTCLTPWANRIFDPDQSPQRYSRVKLGFEVRAYDDDAWAVKDFLKYKNVQRSSSVIAPPQQLRQPSLR